MEQGILLQRIQSTYIEFVACLSKQLFVEVAIITATDAHISASIILDP